jgi:tetratricopeptide (TPR) repeat protein
VFGRSYFYNYAPIHLLSYMVDDALWGLRPAAFALTNVLLHAANGVLFYLLLVELGWRRLSAWAAALIFLVHPVQVESVAWISQRKAVLSLFFFLLALLAFVHYRRADGRRRWGIYAGSLLAFGLALLTKATTVVFPLIAVLFDWHFERERSRATWLLDKLPFLGAAVAVGVATVRAQSPEIGGGTTGYHGGSPLGTLLTMLPVLIRYLGMIAWPTRLSAVYAPPIKTGLDLEVLGAAAVLALIVAGGVYLYRRRSEQLVWLLFFAIGLLPVSQIIPIVTLMNDRYLYLPMLGASAFIVGAVSPWSRGMPASSWTRTWLLATALACLVGFWATLTVRRVPAWQDDHSLWQDAVRNAPGSPKAHFQLAHILEKEGRLQAAAAEYQVGLGILPVTSERYFLGLLYEKLGALDLARDQYLLAISALPTFWEARMALAMVYMKSNQLEEAIVQYEAVLASDPRWVGGHNNVAVAYAQTGRPDRAAQHLEAAARLDAGSATTHYNLGRLYQQMGQTARAIEELERAVALAPGDPTMAKGLEEVRAAGKRR